MKEDDPQTAGSPRVRWILVQGLPVLAMNFSSASAGETLDMLDEFRRQVKDKPMDSVRILTDVSGIQYDPAVSNKWKAARVELHPHILGSAVYGVSGLVGVAIRSYTALMLWLRLPGAKDKIQVFRTREEALGWLLKLNCFLGCLEVLA